MRLAAIDVGSNSIHLVLVETEVDGSFRILAKEKAMVRLSQGVGRDGVIGPAQFAAGLEALRRMRDVIQAHTCDAIMACGTAALRDAVNAPDFLAEARALGLPIQIISGEEEARLIYKAVSHSVPFPEDPVVLMDIGGGSTELTWHRAGRLEASASIPWGTQSLADAVPTSDPPKATELKALGRLIRKILKRVKRELPRGLPLPIQVFATSGTLGELAKGSTGQSSFNPIELKAFHRRLWRETAEGRSVRLGVDPKRADVLHVGSTWAEALLAWLGGPVVRHLPVGLREGMIWEALQHGGASLPPLADRRVASVEALARRVDSDPGHSLHVQNLADQLFQDLRQAFELGDQEREWLAHAAKLHDIGFSISEKEHHKHGAYILQNSNLQGFWPEEVELMAQVVRYHRGKAPNPKKHEAFRRMDPWRQRAVEKLAAILRVADALDRRRVQIIRSAHLAVEEERVVLQVDGPEDVRPERDAVLEKGALLEALLDRPLVWEPKPSPSGTPKRSGHERNRTAT